jgi:hypothetical protein
MESSVTERSKVAIVDLQGPDGQRMLGAIIDPGDGKTWFVKAIGETAPLETITSSFDAFSKSIHMSESPADPHAGHNHASDAPSLSESIDQRLAGWSPPSHWAPEENASPILSAAYLATNDESGARITVTRLGGDGGGSLANINRWRGQLGLPPVERLDSDAGIVRDTPLVVDLETSDASNRMLAAIVPADGSVYYFKMTGTSAGAGAEIEEFNRLVDRVGMGAADQ